GAEDLREHGVLGARLLLLEERGGEPLDAGHVREVLDDGHLLLGAHLGRRPVPIEVLGTPRSLAAFRQHPVQVHGSLLGDLYMTFGSYMLYDPTPARK